VVSIIKALLALTDQPLRWLLGDFQRSPAGFIYTAASMIPFAL
jgi:hypothetical protein